MKSRPTNVEIASRISNRVRTHGRLLILCNTEEERTLLANIIWTHEVSGQDIYLVVHDTCYDTRSLPTECRLVDASTLLRDASAQATLPCELCSES